MGNVPGVDLGGKPLNATTLPVCSGVGQELSKSENVVAIAALRQVHTGPGEGDTTSTNPVPCH